MALVWHQASILVFIFAVLLGKSTATSEFIRYCYSMHAYQLSSNRHACSERCMPNYIVDFVGSPIVAPAVVYSCPGERVIFTCIVQNGHYLYWNVDFSHAGFSNINRQRFITSNQLGSHRSIYYATGHAFNFNLTSNSLGSLVSTASTNAEQRLEGTQVSCQDASSAQNTSVIHIVQGIPLYIMMLYMHAWRGSFSKNDEYLQVLLSLAVYRLLMSHPLGIGL